MLYDELDIKSYVGPIVQDIDRKGGRNYELS